MNATIEKLYEEAREALVEVGRDLAWRRYEEGVLSYLYNGEDEARLRDKIDEYRATGELCSVCRRRHGPETVHPCE